MQLVEAIGSDGELRLYRLAAAQGHADAQGNLGLMFQHGQGVAKNRAEAIRWYRLAAAQGDAVDAAALRRLMCTRPSVEVASRGSQLPRISYRIRAKFIKSYITRLLVQNIPIFKNI